MTLTQKQTRFVGEYLKDLNATRAAIRAGYAEKGAAVRGSELLRNRKVQPAICAALKARAERTRVDQDRVVLELARNGFSDMREIASWGPDGITYKASGELTDDAAATVAAITETVTPAPDGGERRTRTVKLHSKLRALELLGRHLGLFTDKVQLASPPEGFTVRLIGLPDKPQRGTQVSE